MLKKIGLALAVVIVAFVVVVALQPSSFHIERSRKMDAPPYVAFNLINDFHRWSAWSPWEKLDPGMEKKHLGPAFGVGSIYEWSGNDDVGEGRMTIVGSQPEKKVAVKLEFIKPWEATNQTVFSLKPTDQGVEVTWTMNGQNNFMAKAASLFMNMDELVGKDFEAGLAQMEKVAEAEAKAIEKAKAERQRQLAEAAAKLRAEREATEQAEAD